jgi:hypothetical protein
MFQRMWENEPDEESDLIKTFCIVIYFFNLLMIFTYREIFTLKRKCLLTKINF